MATTAAGTSGHSWLRRSTKKTAFNAFETAAAVSNERTFVLRLFIAGTTPRSREAIANLKAVCDSTLEGRYDLEVIDVYQQPERARLDQIVAVPTLLKLAPGPRRRLIGDLSKRDALLKGLGLTRVAR